MNNNVFEITKSVPLKSVLAMCGIEVGQNGKFLCPFHSDHNPSGHIYTNQRGQERWHCFPCGLDGSGIDFVMRRYGLEPLAAATEIVEHFGWTVPRPPPETQSKYKPGTPLKFRPKGKARYV